MEKIKEKAVVYTHLGIGDMICMIGAVRYLADLYERVYLVCKDRNKEIIRDFYSDSDSIILAIIQDDFDLYPWTEKSQYFIQNGFDVYSCGNFNLKITPSIYDFPNSFYDDLGFPRDYRKKYFKVSETKESKELFESFKGRPYIVVHQHSSTHSLPIVETLHLQGETRLIVDINKNQVDANIDPESHSLLEKAIFRPFTEYVKLFEGAEELHLIDSSAFCLAMHLDLSKVKRRVLYKRPGAPHIDNYELFEEGIIPHK